jgi:hypothetical protein
VNNDYGQQTYNYDKEMSNSTFKRIYWSSKMHNLAEDCLRSSNSATAAVILSHEVEAQMQKTPHLVYASLSPLKSNKISKAIIDELKTYIQKVKEYYAGKYDATVKSRDIWAKKYNETELSKKEYLTLLNENQNTKLEELVKNVTTDLDPVIVEDSYLIATANPIYRDGPTARFIRAHFFAPRKNIFGHLYSTFWVNIIVIWVMSLILWVTLYFDALKRLLDWVTALAGRLSKAKAG